MTAPRKTPGTRRRAERARLASLLGLERALWAQGIAHVAGVDEVGIGPLAGPVVAAAVVLPCDIDIERVNDSKKLSPALRERLDGAIRARAIAVSVASVSVAEIDERNIYHAGLEAMRRAVCGLAVEPDHVLVDARTIPGLDARPQNAVVQGDSSNYSIACASIVAKVARDRHMDELDREYPGYGFGRHKGYGTAEHLEALRRLGPAPIHRRSFPVLAQLLGQAGPEFYRLADALARAVSAADLQALTRAITDSELNTGEVRKLRTLLARRRARLA